MFGMTTLANRIKREMDNLGINQEELAERAGVSQSLIHKLTSGKALQSRKISQLAAALGVNTDWLATGKGDKSASPYSDPIHGKIMQIMIATKYALDETGKDFTQEQLHRIYKGCIEFGLEGKVSNEFVRLYIEEISKE
ncbi:MAG: helix-turn-helix domain-containing protein [Mucilaginibacter sp.]